MTKAQLKRDLKENKDAYVFKTIQGYFNINKVRKVGEVKSTYFTLITYVNGKETQSKIYYNDIQVIGENIIIPIVNDIDIVIEIISEEENAYNFLKEHLLIVKV